MENRAPDASIELRRDSAPDGCARTLRFGEAEDGQHQGDEGECCCRCPRKKISMHPVMDADRRQNSAQRWTDDEAEAEGGADQSHALRSILVGGRVGDVRLR